MLQAVPFIPIEEGFTSMSQVLLACLACTYSISFPGNNGKLTNPSSPSVIYFPIILQVIPFLPDFTFLEPEPPFSSTQA